MPDTRSSGMHIRVNPEIKASVEPILAAIGLSFSDYKLSSYSERT